MTKQTNKEWLEQEVRKLGYLLTYISDSYFRLKCHRRNSDSVDIDFIDGGFTFNSYHIDDCYCIDFVDTKKLIAIAEEYKRKVEEND